MSAKSKKSLRYHWVAGGLASALSRFIPVPVVDGIVDERAKRYCLDRTLKYHGRQFDASAVESLYKDSGSVAGWVADKVKQLALYPVRKVGRIVTSSTGVPKDFARTYLLARAIDLCLAKDFLQDDASAKARDKEARNIRDAFDSAFDKLDDMLFKAIVGIVRQQFSEMKPEVSAIFAKMVGKPTKKNDRSSKEIKNHKTSKTAVQNPEDDAAFSKLVSNFDDRFRDEMAERGLDIEAD